MELSQELKILKQIEEYKICQITMDKFFPNRVGDILFISPNGNQYPCKSIEEAEDIITKNLNTKIVGSEKLTDEKQNIILENTLKEVLDVIEPMVRDWTVCPSCNHSWHNHEHDCELNLVVKKIKLVLPK